MKRILKALWLISGVCLPVLAAPSGPPAGNYIQLRSSLQSGATFYVSSGTVKTQLNVIDSNANFQFVPATGSGVTGTLLFAGNSSVSSAKMNLDYWALNTGLFSRILFTNAAVIGTFQQKGWNFEDGGANVMASISTTGRGDFTSLVDTGTLAVSSNTILSGATFYQNAPSQISQVIVSTQTWFPQDGTSFAAERCGKEVQFTITSGTSTTLSSFIPTSLSGSITPHSTSSYVKVGVSGPLTNGAGANAILTLFRNGSNVAGTNGFQATVAAASIQLSSGFTYIDTPATTSATTYAVALESSGGATATFCGSNFTCVLRLQECF